MVNVVGRSDTTESEKYEKKTPLMTVYFMDGLSFYVVSGSHEV